MVYRKILDELVAAVAGSDGALLLDANGEVIEGTGAADERLQLIAAYQGIALSSAQKTSARYDIGSIEYLLCRYKAGSVILRPLKEGFYLMLALGPEASVAQGLRHSDSARERLDAEM
jgi:predicted regulator of Ras-like GTPase activity (Roadblock/LC7/MglB family)